MAAMADGFTSTGSLPPYVLDGLFDSFSDESLLDADDRNNNDVKAGAHESYLLSQQPRVAVSSADSSRVRCGYREQCATRGGEQNIYRV